MVNNQNDLEELKENLAKLNKRKRQLEETIEKAEEKEKNERQKPIRKIAIKVHDLFCAWNHTDGCGWFYENDAKTEDFVWQGYSHRIYLNKIEKLFQDTQISPDILDAILDDLLKIKKIYPNLMRIIRELIRLL